MLTSKCNLRCSYCFANNMINQYNSTDITIENFQTAINFLTSNGKVKIGLIGGEPTLHPNFKEILNIVLQNELIETITLCTNGLILDPYIDLLNNSKIQILFNCNQFPNISSNQEQQLYKNIETYFSNPKNIGTLGINIYDNDTNCIPIFELAQKYHQEVIRISLTVPSIDTCNKLSYFEYFNTRKVKLLELIKLSQKYHIKFSFDCDIPPMCELYTNIQLPYNIMSQAKGCSPIIDITPELEAVRCFGTSHLCKVKITNFSDLNSLYDYFIKTIDQPAANIIIRDRCKQCQKRKNLECFGGCIRFKTNLLNKDNLQEDYV